MPNTAKIYRNKVTGEIILNFPARGSQFTLLAPASVQKSALTQTELDALDAHFWGGDVSSIIDNAILEEKKKLSLGELSSLALVVDEKSEDDDQN